MSWATAIWFHVVHSTSSYPHNSSVTGGEREAAGEGTKPSRQTRADAVQWYINKSTQAYCYGWERSETSGWSFTDKLEWDRKWRRQVQVSRGQVTQDWQEQSNLTKMNWPGMNGNGPVKYCKESGNRWGSGQGNSGEGNEVIAGNVGSALGIT